METKHEFPKDMERAIVYVRPVAVADLPEDVRIQADGLKQLYAVHSSEGEQLALVRDRSLAYVLARQNNMTPVPVH